ncbi:hypothetical protein J4E80_008058 [Alternaria sp. BMP 0032]|nr:hypothetical protein J4E80_008058 [Alternaria sp. BMP 0032]
MSPRSPDTAASPVLVSDAPHGASGPAEETCMQHQDKPEDTDDEQQDELLDDAVSESNTVTYGQEPFETIQHKVPALAAKLFRRSPKDITVHEMKGGSFNRVIGISFPQKPKKFSLAWFLFPCLSARKKKSGQLESYIFRIPRCSYEEDDGFAARMGDAMKGEVSILKVAGSRLPLPIPKVASYDLTTANIFERPYMVQGRLPGRTLATDLANNLNVEQMKCLTKQITALAPTIALVEGPAGDISSQNLNKPPNSPVCTEQFFIPSRNEQKKPEPASTYKPIDYLLERCAQWRAFYEEEGVCFDDVWVSFERISKALETRGFLSGPCVLVHGDLKPYNLLAEVRSDTEAVITGVIDWDSAIIAPEFMAYRAPFWLWAPEDMSGDESDDESVANVEVTTDLDKILKQVFLDNASEKYKLYAFSPEAMLARRMFDILKTGILGGTHRLEEAKSVIKEWTKLHPEDDVRFRDPYESDSEPESDDEPAMAAEQDKVMSDSDSVSNEEPAKTAGEDEPVIEE